MAFQLAGQTLKKGSSFSAGGTMFPSNWLDLSTPEERKNIGITETADTPAAEDTQEPIRLAGGGAPTSNADNTDTSLEPSKPESGPGSDAEWNTFLEALGAGFDGSEPKEIAGNRFTVSETGLTYNKPSRGSALSYGLNRVEKPVEAPIKTDLLPAAPAAPSKPAATTPPAGSATGVTYQQPETHKQEDNNIDWDYSEPDDKPTIDILPPFKDVVGEVPKDNTPPVEEKPADKIEQKPASTPETLAMSRFVDPSTGRHLYTSNIDEGNSAGLSSEGQAFQLFKDSGQTSGTSDVYRLFNPTTGDHFYTASAAEKDVAAGAGYNVEGSVGAAYTAPTENSTAVERYFQPATGQHFYTSDAKEAENLGALGFQREGVAFYTPKASQETQNPAQQYWEAANNAPYVYD